MKVCATTLRHESTMFAFPRSNTKFGFLIRFTQNLQEVALKHSSSDKEGQNIKRRCRFLRILRLAINHNHQWQIIIINDKYLSSNPDHQWHHPPQGQWVALPSMNHFTICDPVLQGLVVQEVEQILQEKRSKSLKYVLKHIYDLLIIWIRIIIWNQKINYKKRIQWFSIDWKNFKNSAKWRRRLVGSILAIGSIKAQLPRQKLAQRWCAEMRSFKFQISSMNSEWEAIKVLHSPLWITALKEEPLRGNWRLCKRSWLFPSHWIVSCTLPKTLPADCQL